MKVPHLINLLVITRIESNSVLVISFLNSNNFTIKFNKTELYTLSGTYNSYNSLYSKCLKFLVL